MTDITGKSYLQPLPPWARPMALFWPHGFPQQFLPTSRLLGFKYSQRAPLSRSSPSKGSPPDRNSSRRREFWLPRTIIAQENLPTVDHLCPQAPIKSPLRSYCSCWQTKSCFSRADSFIPRCSCLWKWTLSPKCATPQPASLLPANTGAGVPAQTGNC